MNSILPFKLTPVASALLLVSTVSVAQDDIEVIEVKGSQLTKVDISIDQSALENAQANDLNDVFRRESEVSVGGSSSVSQKIYVRGIEDTMLNVSVDGAEQSGNLFHHQGRLAVEPELLKQVDVNAGAGRATDGPGALGGAVKFVTKDAQDLLKGDEQFGGSVKAGYYSNNSGYKTSASLYGKVSEDWGLLASATYKDSKNIVDGNGEEQLYSGSKQQIALLKLSGNLTDTQKLSVSYDYNSDDGVKLNRPHWVPSKKNASLQQETGRKTFTLNHEIAVNNYVNLDTTLYTNEQTLTHKDHPRWGTSAASMNTFGGKVFNTSVIGAHTLVVGVDYKQDKAKLGTGGKDSTEKGTVYGVFAQNDWQATEQLLLTLGARYDTYKLVDTQDLSFDSAGFSPNVGATYTVLDGLDVFASYAKAFRGQQTKELFVLDYRNNDPERKPEKATNAEVGLKYHNNGFSAGITLFDSTIEDVVSNEGKVMSNVGKLTNKGANAYAGYQLGDVSAYVSYAQSSPKLDGEPLTDDNMTVGTSVGDTWILDLVYQPQDSMEFGWNAKLVERLTETGDSPTKNEKAGYGVHDLYARWMPLSEEELALTLSVKNVFDKYYFDHASYYVYGDSTVARGFANAGRDIRFNVSWSF
ncbi:hypothetical protein VINI7043_16518 [Vibrio nigripulchritudo ATCC 27043]|uniref:TonB-dependent receptor domain-containing protein n=1 Tax=Vibrio nigripulchritudo TaxID=28173 RepID=UPI00021C414B|nr:TonB-dependent receptor [Vibrio nigripulchritudo]EGU61270.1 hypothetical protein VINI7043_16518 [Vibrio nigripulchritudo ATCC 27043]